MGGTMRIRSALGAAALLVGLGGTARADLLCLKDGRIFENVPLTRIEDGVKIEFENGAVEVPLRLIHDFVIEDDAGYVPETDEDRDNLEKGKVRFDGRWMTVRERDRIVEDLLEEQRAALEEMRERRIWRNRLIDSSKNFDFEVTVPRHVYESYRDLCEEYFDEFVKAFKIKKPRGLGNLQVKFYVDREAFDQVTGMGGTGILGFFRFVEPFELNIYYDRLDPKGTEEVMYHEVGHYLQKLIEIDFKYPHWPGESLCEYYAASKWDPVKKKLEWGGVHAGRLTAIRQDIERDEWVHLREMITGCNDSNLYDYSWGWSFVHFLMSDRKTAPRFKDFYIALARDKKIKRDLWTIGSHRLKTVSGDVMLETFMDHMKLKKDEDLEQMEKEWHTYIREDLAISDARGLANAAWRASRLGRKLRAKRLYEEAIAEEADSSLIYHRYAQTLADLGEHDAARENWAKAVSLDPMVPDYYIDWGKSLLLEPDDETWNEGKRLLHLAHEIEPDNFFLERNLESLLKRSQRRNPQKKDSEPGQKDDGDDESGQPGM